MASTSLTRRGTIYQHPDVTIIDEARPSPDQTMKQQINWGRDHVLLLQCLKEMGLSKPGIQVLEPWGNKWAQWTMPGTQAFHGVLINPSELHDLAVSEAAYKFMLKQDILSCDQILYGMQTLARLTQGAELTRSHAEDINVRSDLPTPLQTDPRNDRFSPASQYGRLIGNIAGIYDILESTSPTAESFPEVFLFGNRQSADWV